MSGNMHAGPAGAVMSRCEPARARVDGTEGFVSVGEWPAGDVSHESVLAHARDITLHEEDGTLLGLATLILPSCPALHEATGFRPDDLETTGFLSRVSVHAGDAREAWLGRLLYAAAREARIRGLKVCAMWSTGLPGTSVSVFRAVPGAKEGSGLVARDLAYATSRFADIAAEGGLPVPPEVLVDEIVRTLESYFVRIWETAWFRAVYEQRLSREAYVYTLGNMHQFVRFTTRLIGRCVAFSQDSWLRAHFARHLREEVNHELIIEQDLSHLGEDVAYVLEKMAPNAPTRRFMAAQESAIGFHQDPILMLAAPLAAEGIAGRLDPQFMHALHLNLERWGVAEPARATKFFSSHIEFDGGDDGHFAGTVLLLERYVRDEARLQLFLSFLSVSTDALLGSYDSWERDLRLFSASS